MKINKSNIFEVYETRKGNRISLFTKSIDPGQTVYEEQLIRNGKDEFREWDPKRSKLAAFILKKASNIGIRKGDIILYLGCSTGTTVSHVSDIVGKEGFIFALDFAPTVLRDFLKVCARRKNIAPLMEDANKPLNYSDKICLVDVVYQDVAQRNQVEIFLKNCKLFLKKGGYGLLALKSRSIDVTKKPKEIYKEVLNQLEKELKVVDYKLLDPFEKDHAMFLCKK